MFGDYDFTLSCRPIDQSVSFNYSSNLKFHNIFRSYLPTNKLRPCQLTNSKQFHKLLCAPFNLNAWGHKFKVAEGR